MKPFIARFHAAAVAAAITLAPGCAYQFKKQEEAAEKMPVNCATAEGDLRVLKSEKANVGEQIAMGVTAIVPASLVIGILTGTEVEKVKVAAGEYNKQLDAKIAEIQTQCGVQ